MIATANDQGSIECRDIRVSYETRGQKREVLRQLDLSVPASTIVSLLGPSGCGKSTLLRVIAGLVNPDGGSVTIGGEGWSKTASSKPEWMSFVFQESALLPWRTVRENVALPIELRGGLFNPQSQEQVARWLEHVGLGKSDWNKKPNELSGGMKMRASIARAMVTKPKILLMDEPFAALDDVLRSKLNDLLLKIAREENCTVVFVTHNIAEAVYLSDTIAIMARGQIAEQIPVHFNELRTNRLRGTPEFASYFGQVSDILFRSALDS
jgi:NitT/TauT family transport system ATP-binding protein